jgi:transcriptional regulator with XRE-family HTH domain
MVGEQQLAVAAPYRVFFCNLSRRPRVGACRGIPTEGLRWMPRLGDVEPRERAGAKTGRRYEYQYERAAKRALALLDHQQKHVCVYCDWHDDFVVESGNPPTRYLFHQVKGRKSDLGPWTFIDFFGLVKRESLPLPRKATFKRDAIVPLMLRHFNDFPDTCDGIAFVTNTGIEPRLRSFMDSLKGASTLDDLPDEDKVAFDFMALAYLAGKKPLAPSRDVLFERLRGVFLWLDEPHLDEENFALMELVDLIDQYSEIDLVPSQSKNIARDVITRVRVKAHHDKTQIPTSDDQLRQEKGITLRELLGLLSLSIEGYEALRRGDAPANVKTLSRLQRYCKGIGRTELIPFVCGAKAEWDAWLTVERHSMNPLDYVALVDKAKAIVAGHCTVSKMVEAAKDIAKDFTGLTSAPLQASHVLGLMFSLIAQAEPPSLSQ